MVSVIRRRRGGELRGGGSRGFVWRSLVRWWITARAAQRSPREKFSAITSRTTSNHQST
jgi:hypothetical protein